MLILFPTEVAKVTLLPEEVTRRANFRANRTPYVELPQPVHTGVLMEPSAKEITQRASKDGSGHNLQCCVE